MRLIFKCKCTWESLGSIFCILPHLWECVLVPNTFFWPHVSLHSTLSHKFNVRDVTFLLFFYNINHKALFITTLYQSFLFFLHIWNIIKVFFIGYCNNLFIYFYTFAFLLNFTLSLWLITTHVHLFTSLHFEIFVAKTFVFIMIYFSSNIMRPLKVIFFAQIL
jgi:hypothetical protein